MPYVQTGNPGVVVIATCGLCGEKYPASGTGYHVCPQEDKRAD